MNILQRLAAEPVLVRNALAGIAAVVLVFGITIPDGTLNTVADLIGILLPIVIAAISARSKVTPV